MAEWARDTLWRQGNLLTDETATALGLAHPEHPGDTVVIVATHDCDLAQSPENEQTIEVVVGRRIDSMDGNYTHAKTARTLHSQFEGDALLLAEFGATGKQTVSKKELFDFEPQDRQRLSPSGLASLQRWLAARYRRSAFPDEFELRLVSKTKLANKIAKAVKPHGTLIIAVLFDKRSGKWKDIELRYCDVLSEEALTYRQFSLMKPWRLEYISLGADPQQQILAE